MPQYCRATPTERRPFFGKPVSSMIHQPPACKSILGTTHWHTRRSNSSSDPLRLGHEVMQRLMPRAGMHRIDPRGHRLDALARQRQHQAGAIALQARAPIRVSQSLGQVLHVLLKPSDGTHRPSQTK